MSQWQYPIKEIHENIVVRKDNKVMAFYRVPSLSFAISDEKGKRDSKVTVAGVLRKFVKNENFEIAMIPKDFLLTEKMRDLVPSLDEEKREIGINYFDRTVEALTDEMYIPYDYEWMIGVPLLKENREKGFINNLKASSEEVVSKAIDLFGYEVEKAEDWYLDYEESNQTVYQALTSLRARKMTHEDLYYNQRLQFLRYIPHEKEDVIANHAIMNVTDTEIEVLPEGYIHLISAYGESYLSILPVGHIPSPLNYYPLGELVKSFNFPVELEMKFELVGLDGVGGVVAKMGRSRVRVGNIAQENYNAGGTLQDRIIEIVKSLPYLEKDVGSKEPLYLWGAFLVISANSLSQLKNRRRIVLSSFNDMGIELAEAAKDTPYLFQSLMYGNGFDNNLKKWSHLTNSDGLSQMMLFTDSKLGSSTGYYIGRTDTNFGRWANINEAIQS